MSQEFRYLSSAETSKLFDLILQLSTELHVTTHRLRAVETILIRHGVLGNGEVDDFAPTADEATTLDASRTSYLARLMRIITEGGPAEHPLRKQWETALSTKVDE